MASMQQLPESGKSRPKSDLWFSRQKAKADEQWLEQFEKLKNYKARYGDCMVPNSYTEDFSLRGEFLCAAISIVQYVYMNV